MTYLKFINDLKEYREDDFAQFQAKLIPTQQKILGIRTPVMRKLAKQYQTHFEEILLFPDEYYEVTFIKAIMISTLPYQQFVNHLEYIISRIDNWATCDSFKNTAIQQHKKDFLPILKRLFDTRQEFYQRYVFVVFLNIYIEEEYIPIIEEYLTKAEYDFYYVHMAVAWLVAEILVKKYSIGVQILQRGILPHKTHNKAIQKAIESYRLTENEKNNLRSLKIKNIKTL